MKYRLVSESGSYIHAYKEDNYVLWSYKENKKDAMVFRDRLSAIWAREKINDFYFHGIYPSYYWSPAPVILEESEEDSVVNEHNNDEIEKAFSAKWKHYIKTPSLW